MKTRTAPLVIAVGLLVAASWLLRPSRTFADRFSSAAVRRFSVTCGLILAATERDVARALAFCDRAGAGQEGVFLGLHAQHDQLTIDLSARTAAWFAAPLRPDVERIVTAWIEDWRGTREHTEHLIHFEHGGRTIATGRYIPGAGARIEWPR